MLVAGLAALALASVAHAQPSLEVWMLTFGAGEPVFLKFGHNALMVRGRDEASGRVLFERVYDYGLFDGSSPTLVADFLQGRMQYWMGVTTLGRTMRRYRATNRDVFAQKLRLTAEQAAMLHTRLQDNAKPENRYYRYDYYYDNCSTRVRDAVDAVTDGAVKAAFTGPAALTLRDHSLRLTASDLLYYVGLDLGLADVDRPINIWVESFLPFKLQESMRKVQVTTADGQRQPLVEREEVWFEGTRSKAPSIPPDYWPQMLLVGVAIGGLFAVWGRWGRRSLLGRRLFMVVASGLGAGLAFFGLVLLYLWGFTDHAVAYANQNVMYLAPWAIAAPVVALVSRRPGQKALYFVFASAAVLAIFGLSIKILPGVGQQTHRLAALLLPIWCGLTAGAYAITTRPAGGAQTPRTAR